MKLKSQVALEQAYALVCESPTQETWDMENPFAEVDERDQLIQQARDLSRDCEEHYFDSQEEYESAMTSVGLPSNKRQIYDRLKKMDVSKLEEVVEALQDLVNRRRRARRR